MSWVEAVLPVRRLIVPGAFAAMAAAVGALAGFDPALAISAAFAFGFTLIVLADLYVGVVLFTLLAFVAQIPGLGSEVTFAKVAGLLLALSWAMVLTTREGATTDLIRAHPLASTAIVMFLTWLGLSQLWATESGPVLDAFFRLTLNVTLMFVVFSAVREPKHVVGIVAAFVAGATLNALYGLLIVPPESAESVRLSGGLSNPNELATILVAAMALSLGVSSALREKPVARLAALGASGICTMGLLMTGSRGGLVALAVAFIAYLVTGRHFRGRLLVVGAIVALAGTGYYTYAASPEQRERVTNFSSGTGRTDIWIVGWRMVEDRPLTGVGGGNFTEVSNEYVLAPGSLERTDFFIGESPKVVHNMYLQMWAELGTVGLLLFLSIMAFGLYAALRAARLFAQLGDLPMETVARAIFVALAAVLAADFFGSRQYDKELWLLLGLAPASLAIARARLGAQALE